MLLQEALGLGFLAPILLQPDTKKDKHYEMRILQG